MGIESSEVVVRIVDTQTKQTLRKIPSEEILAISKSLDQMTGLLIAEGLNSRVPNLQAA